MPPTEPRRYDAFLSYNSQDGLAVEELAGRLKAEGLAPYLEAWELLPGREIQPSLAGALNKSKACVVFLGPNGLGPWQKQELQVAIDKRTRDEAFHVIPVLLPGTERPRRGDVAHLEFLINASWVEFLTTLDDERAFRSLVSGITGTKPPEPDATRFEGVCPYRGLEAFRPDDAKFFFGRENLTGWLVSALRREVRAAQGVRFLGVLGPSGSGKSSVALAGLVPRLMAGAIERSDHWPVAILRPGNDPLKNLAAAVVPRFLLAGALPDAGQLLKLADDARADARILDVFAQAALHDRPDDVRLVVVVDQFEEVFTYRPQEGPARARFEQDRDQFFANLLNAAATPGGRVVVVLTMRSDFLSACAKFPQLSAVLSAHQDLVGPMTAAELREAIERPAYLVGCEVEASLTERLLADVEGQPGALPLLQFALTEVWKKREVRRLTLRAYTELGKDDKGEPRGIEGVLDHRASEIYRNLTAVDRDLCRRLFLRLVQPGEGTGDTKRRVPYRELLPDDPARAEGVRKLVQTLASRDARLITTEGAEANDSAVEVAHEGLIRGWTQLRQWVEAERVGLRIQRRLTEAAHEWAAARHENKEGYLYSKARLEACQEWLETHRDGLSATEAEFLSASEEAERQRERDAHESDRRLREAVAAAQEAQRQAEIQAGLADSRRLAAVSVAARERRLDQALLLAAEAVKFESTNEARNALFDALCTRPEVRLFLHTDERYVSSVAFNPDGKTLAAGFVVTGGDGGGGVALFDATSQQWLEAKPLPVTEGRVLGVAFSSDGKTLAAGCSYLDGGGVVLFDATSQRRLEAKPLPVTEGKVLDVVFSPDGKTLAARYRGDGRSGVVLFDATSHQRLQTDPVILTEGAVSSVVFSPDGGTLAAGYDSLRDTAAGGVVLFDATSHQRLQIQSLREFEPYVPGVAFSPDGKALAVGYRVKQDANLRHVSVKVFNATNLLEVPSSTSLTNEDAPIIETKGDVSSVAFSPDGKTLAAGYGVEDGDGGVLLFDATRGVWHAAQRLLATEGRIVSVAFSPDGKTLAAAYRAVFGGASGVLLLSPKRSQPALVQGLPASGGVWSRMAFSPDGKTLAGSGDKRVVLLDAESHQQLQAEGLAVTGSIRGVAFSADGKTLAVGYAERIGASGAVLFDAKSRQRLEAQPPFSEIEGDVWCVAFSPDGKTLAAGCQGGPDGVVLFDTTSRQRLHVQPLAGTERVRSVAFSPDGKTLAVGCLGGPDGVVLFDTTSRQRLRAQPLALPGTWRRVFSVAFSPDGKTLAAGGDYGNDRDDGVVVFVATSRQGLMADSVVVTEGVVRSVAFSPDGKTLAVGYGVYYRGGGVLLFDARRRQRLLAKPLAVVEGQPWSVAFSPDGKTLAVAERAFGDKTAVAILCDVDLESWRRQAGTIANRNLTRDEWRRYFPDTPYHATFDNLPVPPEEKRATPPALPVE